MVIQRTEEVGGILAAGISAAGNPYGLGRVRNLSVAAGPLGSGVVGFAWDGVAEGVAFHAYVDGIPEVDTEPATGWEVEPLGEGVFDLDVLPYDETKTVPFLAPDLIGNKAFLRWDAPETGADRVTAYRIYNGETLVGTVDRIDVLEPVEVAVTGTGSPVVSGSWTLGNADELLALTVGDDDDWELAREDGTVIASGEILPGVPQSTASGIFIEWLPGTYTEDDEWEIPVQVRRYWISPEEEAGEVVYTVKAVDITGSESDGENVTVDIGGIPDAPAASFAWDAEYRELTVTFTGAPADGFARIYLNWDAATEELTEYIEEDGHIAREEGPGGSFVLSIPEGVAGTVLGYVRGENAGGVVERNANLLSAPLLADGDVDAPAPEIIAAVAAPGGAFFISWRLDISRADLTEVRLYSGSTANPTTLDQVVPLSLSVNDFPVAESQFLTSETYIGAVYFRLEAVWSGGVSLSEVAGPFTPVADGAGDVTDLEGWEN